MANPSTEYRQLIDSIGNTLNEARNNLAHAVNSVMVDVYWQVDSRSLNMSKKGSARAAYGENLLPRLSKDLTLRFGKGFNRSNLIYLRKLYLACPKRGTLSHKLTWSHYYEILKQDDPLEISFYVKETEIEHWSVLELKRQIMVSAVGLLTPFSIRAITGCLTPLITSRALTDPLYISGINQGRDQLCFQIAFRIFLR